MRKSEGTTDLFKSLKNKEERGVGKRASSKDANELTEQSKGLDAPGLSKHGGVLLDLKGFDSTNM